MKKIKFPQLKFTVDPKKDLEIYEGFLETAKFFDLKTDLQFGFYRFHPELEKVQKSQKTTKEKLKLTENYIIQRYKKDKKQINHGTKEAQKLWRLIKKVFFKQTSEIFKNQKWPRGKYIAYPTIWGTYPRLLNEKIFFFPYDYGGKDFVSVVIMHEMLHFIFYEYALKKHPRIFKKLATESGIFWDLAEIFNVIVLTSPKFAQLYQNRKKLIICYPQHKKYIKYLKDLWWQNIDIDNWLIKSFDFLSSKNIRNIARMH
jgi:hypothetical protein